MVRLNLMTLFEGKLNIGSWRPKTIVIYILEIPWNNKKWKEKAKQSVCCICHFFMMSPGKQLPKSNVMTPPVAPPMTINMPTDPKILEISFLNSTSKQFAQSLSIVCAKWSGRSGCMGTIVTEANSLTQYTCMLTWAFTHHNSLWWQPMMWNGDLRMELKLGLSIQNLLCPF